MTADPETLKKLCLQWLAIRDYSQQQLQQKLINKGHSRPIAAAVTDDLAKEGWLDDCRFAENYSRAKIMKGYGPLRIVYGLQQHGIELIDCSDIDGTTGFLEKIALESGGGWENLIAQAYLKKFAQSATLSASEWSKRSRFLSQRGFSAAMISALAKQLNIKLS